LRIQILNIDFNFENIDFIKQSMAVNGRNGKL
jgi:hypothetical protein